MFAQNLSNSKKSFKFEGISHIMAHHAPATGHTPASAFERLLNILNTLRQHCPWDRKQTMQSLRHLTIEEMYELTDAILDEDMQEIQKELGDLMMHLVFYAKIADEQGAFDIRDVLNTVCDKLIDRHPHIYADIEIQGEDDVKQNWESLKLKEGNRSVLSGVPKGLPSLVKAYRIQDKVRGVGFDWEDKEQVWEKVEEELQEFKSEFDIGQNAHIDADRAEQEFGDLLFSLINYARHLQINPENALERTNKKFMRRFEHVESRAREQNLQLQEMSLADMDVYWQEAKKLGL